MLIVSGRERGRAARKRDPLFAQGSFTQFGGRLDVTGAIPGIVRIFSLSVMMVRRRSPEILKDLKPEALRLLKGGFGVTAASSKHASVSMSVLLAPARDDLRA